MNTATRSERRRFSAACGCRSGYVERPFRTSFPRTADEAIEIVCPQCGGRGQRLRTLDEFTYRVEHNPNCRKRVLLRLCGPTTGHIDGLPIAESRDWFGVGDSIDEAFADLRKRYEPETVAL